MDENLDLGWLIRDSGNKIRGPYRHAEVLQMLRKGQLKSKTEISCANYYWFAVEEKAELGRFFPELGVGNGGPQEQPTQMTATLTEADVRERAMEMTTFTKAPGAGESGAGNGQIEWLSDELAEEFGGVGLSEEGTSVSLSLEPFADAGKKAEPTKPEPKAAAAAEALAKEARDKEKEKEGELLRRATVKADTLPSEHKSFRGDRPKPIDALIRGPAKNSGASAKEPSGRVSVPVEDGPAALFFDDDADDARAGKRRGQRKVLVLALAGAAVVAGIGGYLLLRPAPPPAPAKPPPPARHMVSGAAAAAAEKFSLLAFDLDGAKSALSDLEQDNEFRGETATYLAEAIVKREFLYDVEGAIIALQAARQQANSKRTEAEVDNLSAIYGFDRDPTVSIELLRRNVEAFKDDSVFRYNLALGLLRTNHAADAVAILDSLIDQTSADKYLLEDVAVAQAWALDSHCSAGLRDALCKRASEAEEAYLRALEANPGSAKARLGLALFRLRRQGSVRGVEADFRTFVDLAPELDPPTHVINFRKLDNTAFYSFAHAQIVELNTPTATMPRPSPLIMAADGIISSIQGRTSEAGNILENALNAAPGDVNVLKLAGYLRWRNGEFDEVVGTLKDLRERGSYAVNLMLGKAYAKQRHRDLAERYFTTLIESFPARSEGHSLLGELLLDSGDRRDEARTELQAALQKDPFDVLALRALQRTGTVPTLSSELLKYLPF